MPHRASAWVEAGPLAALRRPSAGAVEAMKLAGFAAMVCDHLNKIVLGATVPLLSIAGRLAFPLFAFVLAVNLVHYSRDRQGYFSRLAIWGIATQPLYHWATGRGELNILLTLAVGLQLVLAVEGLGEAGAGRPRRIALLRLAVTLAASLATDYPFLGPLLVLVFHAWLAEPTAERTLLAAVVLAALNQHPLLALPALAAIPLALALALWQPPLPRAGGWLFYSLYPGHLALLRLLA